MKILAFDIGDQWIGAALSDPLGIIATPYTTIQARTLDSFLQEIFTKESLECVIIGYPLTLRGTESDQTRKVSALVDILKIKYPNIPWILWDERLTSKQAARFKKTITKEEKLKSHARAAALILESYLQHKALQSKKDN